jgi:hypothetical protein
MPSVRRTPEAELAELAELAEFAEFARARGFAMIDAS